MTCIILRVKLMWLTAEMPTGIKNVTLEMILFYWSMLVMLRAVMETPGKYSAFGLRLDSEEDIEFCRSLGLLKKKKCL